MTRRKRVVIGCTGSVASVKIPELVVKLVVGKGYDVRVILSSKAALHFFVQSKAYMSEAWEEFMAVGGYSLILSDNDEWNSWKKIGDPVLHVQLCKWADVLLVAPASANTLSKMKNGLCDSLLLSMFFAWDYRKKWVILAPAMNTYMWSNSVMEECISYFENRNKVEKHKIVVVEPIEKILACGDTGKGAMASVSTIVENVDLVVEGGPESDLGAVVVDDSLEDGQISHPALLADWQEAYTRRPFTRMKYFWRYSPFCVSNRSALRLLAHITSTVAVVSAVMALTGGASWYKLQSYMNQRVENLRTKLPSMTRPVLPSLDAAKEKLSSHAATIKDGARAKLDKLDFKRKQG